MDPLSELTLPPEATLAQRDAAYCRRALRAVSRTFSKPISLLDEPLELTLTVGYLACRIVDTIEDLDGLSDDYRLELFNTFLGVLARRRPASDLEQAFAAFSDTSPELELGRHSATVFRVIERLPPQASHSCRRWVGELAYGMQLYAARPKGEGGISALNTGADLERYCYFVAGTVGHLITDLFVQVLAEGERSQLEPHLRRRAESFGIGLQLTNILKDVAEDHACGRCFIPEECLREHDLSPRNLLEPRFRRAAHASAVPVFERALTHLDIALEYSLAVPARYATLRLFCLLPLWMAIRTLAVARGSDAMFTVGQDVKISRQDVGDVIAECHALVARDAALAERYAQLRATARGA